MLRSICLDRSCGFINERNHRAELRQLMQAIRGGSTVPVNLPYTAGTPIAAYGLVPVPSSSRLLHIYRHLVGSCW